jgi:hypothetical protein
MNSARNYEASPACILLATVCAVCGKALVDSKSVEAGMGPDCRGKHGYGISTSAASYKLAASFLARGTLPALQDLAKRATGGCEAAQAVLSDAGQEHGNAAWRTLFTYMANNGSSRMIANALVYQIALDRKAAHVPYFIAALYALGYTTLAKVLGDRTGHGLVSVSEALDFYTVSFRYNDRLIASLRTISGAHYNRLTKVWMIPVGLMQRSSLMSAIRNGCDKGTIVLGKNGMMVL